MNETKENKMGVLPIKKLIISMSLPMMISMLVQALYNVVDSVFVANYSQDGLTALSAAFPMQLLSAAFATGTGVGVNAFLSRSLGEKDTEKANKVANTSVFLGFLTYILFLLIGIFATKPYFILMSGTGEETKQIVDYGVSYLSICLIGSLGIYGQFVFEKLLQSTGKTVFTMITQLTGAVINIIFDPIFIFGLDMGPSGAAYATILGQHIAMIIAFIFNMKYNKEITLAINSILHPEWKIIKGIYKIGIPSIIMTSVASVMNYGLNMILFSLTPDGTSAAVFGIYYKLQSFVFMPVFGLNNGMVPILAYNYGAGNKDRMKQTIKYSIMYAVGIMIFGMAIIQIFPEQLLSLFKADENLTRMGVIALRLITTSFTFAGFCIIAGSVFQALNHAFFSLLVSIVRQVIVLLPAAYILSLFGNVDLVWLSFPIAEIFSFTLSLICMIKLFKKMKL